MRELRMYEALVEAQAEEMRRDERVFVMGEDVGLFGGTFRATESLMAEFGSRRVRDTPIAEMGLIGTAVGAAATGLRPIAELMFMDFLGSSLDPLLNQASKLRYMFGGKVKVPLTVRTVSGTFTLPPNM